MKKIFLVVLILMIGLFGITQPIVNRSNSSITVQDSRLAAQYNLLVPRYNDTTAANLQKGIDTCGAIIFTYSTNGLWVRSCADGKKWVAVGAGGGGSGTVTDFVFTDGNGVDGTVTNSTTTPTLSLAFTPNGILKSNGTALSAAVAGTDYLVPSGTYFIGTTSNAFNRASASQTLTGVSIDGNAATATALQTARTIQGVSFDGTANINIINGTGFVKATGTTISYDNSTYVTSNIYSADGTLAGNRAVALNSLTLNFNQGANSMLTLDPTANNETSRIRAFNTTNDDNETYLYVNTSATSSTVNINSSFNGGEEVALITLYTQTGQSIITNQATTSTFTGNVGIGVTPAVLFQVQSGGNDFLSIDPTAGAEVSMLRAYNTTDDDNYAIVNFLTSNTSSDFNLGAAFNGESKVSVIEGHAESGSATLSYSADTHTFTGPLVLNGSTSGSVTVKSDALGNTPNATTLSGTGYVPAVMFSRLTSNNTLSDINTVQAVFGSSQDVFTFQPNTTYRFYGKYYLTHGATSHSVGMSFEEGGGIAVTSINYTTMAEVTVANTNTASQTMNNITQTSNTAINAAGANAQETIAFDGWITIGATGGTLTPSITFSAAPGGSPAAVAYHTWIEFWPVGTNTVTVQGAVN